MPIICASVSEGLLLEVVGVTDCAAADGAGDLEVSIAVDVEIKVEEVAACVVLVVVLPVEVLDADDDVAAGRLVDVAAVGATICTIPVSPTTTANVADSVS